MRKGIENKREGIREEAGRGEETGPRQREREQKSGRGGNRRRKFTLTSSDYNPVFHLHSLTCPLSVPSHSPLDCVAVLGNSCDTANI